MRVQGPPRPERLSAASRARRAEGGARFEPMFPERAGEARPAGSVAAPALDALIALQTAEERPDRRRLGVRRGRFMLDALDAMKIAHLAGRASARDMARLARIVEGREDDSGDARLESILDDIELRARVELAKMARLMRG